MVNYGAYSGWFDTVAGRAARNLAFTEMQVYCAPRVLSGELVAASMDSQIGCSEPGLKTNTFTDGGENYVGITCCYVCQDQTAFNNLDVKWMQRTGDSEVGSHGSANTCTP